MHRLPPGFDDVATAQSRKSGSASIIAVVVDALSPTRTGGSSYMSTFTVKDCDFGSESWRGLKVKYFHNDQAHLPDPDEGDVILLRNIRVGFVKGVCMYVSSNADSALWTMWKKRGSVKSKPGFRGPDRAESEYALRLLNNGSAQDIPQGQRYVAAAPQKQLTPKHTSSQTASPRLPGRKFCLLKDAAFSSFIDITGQVVKTFMEGDGRFILYVTDYTSNKNLYNYVQPSRGTGDDDSEYRYINKNKGRQWPGPFGTMTIQVTLWEPHARYARENVKVDDYVTLYNVNIKTDKFSGRMEGVLHTDRRYPDKIQVHIINDNETDVHIRQLVGRKKHYWRTLRADLPSAFGDSNRSEKSTSDLASSRKKQKLEEKRERLKEEKRRKKKDPEQPDFPRLVQTKRDELNPHIRASNPAIPCRLIRDILDPDTHTFKGPDGVEFQLPFQNVRYRSSVRVVDFFPHNIEDFSVSYNVDYALTNDGGDASDDSDPGARRWWEWRFCLLVEDGGPNVPHLPPGKTRERMPLLVYGSEAEFLLHIDAVNLRDNPETLAQLRERLFLLWGDLEERKNADIDAFYSNKAGTVSAKPFTCCIKEYGVKTGDKESNSDVLGWERRFQMFQTTIT
ncbi:telomere-binding alpha subunit central domain-containing protein [Nannizzia gypsea CBS 118893]|uniref:Protection of telomeres protein 1 n=1 Tax=Arthroderma gypseum (strain ATCC MYA-4604 / CBS 118893) TaxID=535722 RepID=E4UNM3_ARTGP|nr:telomere-binding alpha subunit central domain-containing protein [Nannizzia gypsea CBS 118893]EFR00421.1 telomere-binding alpha subunit central domain-containing protein [Nannizzia gypsea CBS 118893]